MVYFMQKIARSEGEEEDEGGKNLAKGEGTYWSYVVFVIRC
jgi:hypothetical protein